MSNVLHCNFVIRLFGIWLGHVMAAFTSFAAQALGSSCRRLSTDARTHRPRSRRLSGELVLQTRLGFDKLSKTTTSRRSGGGHTLPFGGASCRDEDAGDRSLFGGAKPRWCSTLHKVSVGAHSTDQPWQTEPLTAVNFLYLC